MRLKGWIILIAVVSAPPASWIQGITAAIAGEVECAGLIAKIKAGERYGVSIDVQKEAMRVQTATDHCYDPIDAWVKRGLPLTSTPPLSAGGGRSTSSPQLGEVRPGSQSPTSSLPRPFIPPPADLVPPPPTIGPDGRVLPSLTAADRDSAPPSMAFTGGGIRKAPEKTEGEETPTAPQEREGGPSAVHTSVGAGGEIISQPEPGADGVAGGADGVAGGADGKGGGPDGKGGGPDGEGGGPDGEGGGPDGEGGGDGAGETAWKCDRKLEEFWQAGKIHIKGTRFWLLGTYTLDTDDDGKTDNVVFKVRTQGRVDSVLRYFPTGPGKRAGKDIEDLKLDHDDMLYMICPGNIVFGGPTAGEMAADAATEDPAKRCESKLEHFWRAGELNIKGTMYWLSGVFSIDLDGDGGVDNIGFKVKTQGKVGNVIRYFPMAPGQLSAQTINDLKLEDDNDVFMMCAGNLTFERPKSAKKYAEISEAPPTNVTGIQETGTGAKKGEEQEGEPELEVTTPSKLPKIKTKHLILLGGVFLVGGGIFGLYWINRTPKKDGEDGEEGEEEDEEDEEEA
ncbi:MAG: hypothetical protein V3R66_07315 [Rhodospirillales bacterium]